MRTLGPTVKAFLVVIPKSQPYEHFKPFAIEGDHLGDSGLQPTISQHQLSAIFLTTKGCCREV